MIGVFVQLNAESRRNPIGYVVCESGCWDWVGCTQKGYGALSVGGKQLRAFRVLYERIHGPIPKGLELDHKCRNIRCVNPDHMEPVTHGENLARGDTLNARNLAKTQCPAGHPYDPTNTPKEGGRRCRECGRDRQRLYNRRRRAINPSYR